MMLAQRMAIGAAMLTMLAFANTALAQPPVTPGSPLETSQRISLDLKGVDILDVLKLLSQKSGLNFIAGRNVSGRITIFVNDVDVWDAFELIIGANDLAYERRGNIVTVMMARDYELIYGEKFQERKESLVQALKYAKVTQVATVLNQIKSSIGRVVADEATNTVILNDVPTRLNEMREVIKRIDRPTESRIYNLSYAEAEKLKDKVHDLLSPIGTFTFDARTNKVVISDLKEVLAKTDLVINAFDVPDGEVLIESRIINVTLTDDKSLGIDWQRVFGGLDIKTRGNFDEISGDIISGVGAVKDSTAPKGGAFQLLSSKGQAQVVIEALKTIGKVETISNPRLMVSNNQEAKILVGTKEAFITSTTTVPATGSIVTAPDIKTQDVGTQLYVTPNVKRDGHIQLKIRPVVSSVARTITSVANTVVPIVQTTEAETNVLVKSGSTIIIGGLIDTKTSQSDDRIPWLGDLPVVGAPFRGHTSSKKKSELVVFLTPQIIRPDGSPVLFPKTAEETSGLSGQASDQTVILQDPVPASYRYKVREHLQAQLTQQFQAAGLSKGTVIVSFILSHDGQLMGEQQVTSPQGEAFIRAAKDALTHAKFPPFPEGSEASEVRFRLAVEYAP